MELAFPTKGFSWPDRMNAKKTNTKGQILLFIIINLKSYQFRFLMNQVKLQITYSIAFSKVTLKIMAKLKNDVDFSLSDGCTLK